MKILRTVRITFADANPVALSTVATQPLVAGFGLYAPTENVDKVFFKFADVIGTPPTTGNMLVANSATIAPDHAFPIEMSRGDGGTPGQLFDLRQAYVRGTAGDAVEVYWHELRSETF